MTKACSKCKIIKELSEYHKSAKHKYGIKPDCKVCRNEFSRSTYKSYYALNALKINEKCRAYHAKNSDNRKQTMKAWKQSHRAEATALENKRRAAKLNATPPWLTKNHFNQIKEIYKNCPKGYHVDHIIPLKGKNVCGLHVPWNLQYLPAIENMRKSNLV